MVMGINVQICWEKFCNYFEVEPRYVPMEGNRFHLNGEEAVKLCDENTIGVVAVLASTFDGSYELVAEISDASTICRSARASTCRSTWTGLRGYDRTLPRPGSRLGLSPPRVASINTSGHKYGRVTLGSAGPSGAIRRPCLKTWSSG